MSDPRSRLTAALCLLGLLATSCYKETSWSPNGHRLESSQYTKVSWGSRRQLELQESGGGIDIVAEQTPLCRGGRRGELVLVDHGSAHKHNLVWLWSLGTLAGAMSSYFVLKSDAPTETKVAGGIGAGAVTVWSFGGFLLPETATSSRERREQAFVWQGEAEPCDDAVPVMREGLVVRASAGEHMFSWRLRTDMSGHARLEAEQLAGVRRWMKACDLSVALSVDFADSGDAPDEAQRFAQRTDPGIDYRHHAVYNAEVGVGAGHEEVGAWKSKPVHIERLRAFEAGRVRGEPSEPDRLANQCTAERERERLAALERERQEREQEAAEAAREQEDAWNELRQSYPEAGDGMLYAWVSFETKGEKRRKRDHGRFYPLTQTRAGLIDWTLAQQIEKKLEAEIDARIVAPSAGRIDAHVTVGSYAYAQKIRKNSESHCEAPACRFVNEAPELEFDFIRPLADLLERAAKASPPPRSDDEGALSACNCYGGFHGKNRAPICFHDKPDLPGVREPEECKNIVDRMRGVCQSAGVSEVLPSLYALSQTCAEAWERAKRDAEQERERERSSEREMQAARERKQQEYFVKLEQRKRQIEEARRNACSCGLPRVNGQCPQGYEPRALAARCGRGAAACTCPM